MAEASIPVDLFNPGQVFACIGFAEAADVLLGSARGVFDWSDPMRTVFRLRADGNECPVLGVLRFIEDAQAEAVAPAGSANFAAWDSSFGTGPVLVPRELGYPFPDPEKPPTLACRLTNGLKTLMIDYWGDSTDRPEMKLWGGSKGKPGAALAADALALVRGHAITSVADPFAFSAPQSGSFRLDWRRDYIPINTGFSLNNHKSGSHQMVAMGFPLVELLGALGLGNARPLRPEWRNDLLYCYAVAGRFHVTDQTWLPLPLLRAALGAAALPFPMRHFKMLLDWPGKEGQARSITTVTEENLA